MNLKWPACLRLSDRETSDGGIVAQDTRPVGDRSKLIEVCSEARLWPVRRRVGGIVEQHDSGSDQDTQIRHHGSEGLPG